MKIREDRGGFEATYAYEEQARGSTSARSKLADEGSTCVFDARERGPRRNARKNTLPRLIDH